MKTLRALILTSTLVLAQVASGGAKDVTITFNDEEQKALWAVFDAALKARGMELGGNVVYLWQKLQAAAEKAAEPPKVEEPKK